MKTLITIFLLLTSILPMNAQTTITGKEALEDLAFLVKNIKEAHFNPYLHISEADWNKEITKYKEKYSQLDKVELVAFSIDMKKLVAMLQDAHSSISFANEEFSQYPDSLQFFPFLVKVDELGEFQINDETLLSGKTILKINGQDVEALYEEAMSLQAGTEAWKHYYTSKIYFPILLYLKNIRVPFKVTVPQESHKGFATMMTVPPSDGVSLNQIYERFLPIQNPYTLSFPKPDIAMISYNQCEYYEKFKTFLDSSFHLIQEKKIEKLIIDIRYNSGGNSALNDLLLPYISQKKYRQSSGRHWKVSQAMKDRLDNPIYKEAFDEAFIKYYRYSTNGSKIESENTLITPKKPKYFFKGKTCVLIGTQTFSSANFLADAIKTYQLSTLIGKPTGELTNDFGELITFSMPHSQLAFSCSTAYDIGADGNAEKIEAVIPDIEVKGDALEFAIQWFNK